MRTYRRVKNARDTNCPEATSARCGVDCQIFLPYPESGPRHPVHSSFRPHRLAANQVRSTAPLTRLLDERRPLNWGAILRRARPRARKGVLTPSPDRCAGVFPRGQPAAPDRALRDAERGGTVVRQWEQAGFTYVWCDDHTIVVIWCPRCEVPVVQQGQPHLK